ncbi:MAG: molybdopterin-dependent oxidoreductase [Pseudonocardiaceae bacterium]
MPNISRLLMAALLILPLLSAGAVTTAGPGTTAVAVTTAKPTFVVDGRVAAPLTLTVDQLRDFPLQRQRVRFLAGGGPEVHRYQGALLIDVLTSAKPQFDPAVKNDKLRYAVLVGATDGYQAVLAWGEIDPAFANTRALLAFEEDGRALDRPRLVVPGDEHGGRYVTDVSSVSLFRVGT